METDRRAECAAMHDELDRELMAAIIRSKEEAGGDRIAQIAALARALGARQIGIAHCVAFADQAQRLAEMLEPEFEVTMVGCKVFGLQAGDVLEGVPGGTCNPVGQAMVLNDAGTDLNVEMGLCLGHDMTFHKHSLAPVTVLIVKDRTTGHQPLSALS